MLYKGLIFLGLFFNFSFLFGQCATNNLSTTFASNNGQDGNIFDVVALTDIEIRCFDSHFDAGTLSYQIYYRLGTGVGFENTAGAWFLAGSGTTVSAGPSAPTLLNITNPIQVCAGSRVAFYITNTGGFLPNARYTNGTGLGNVFSSNANLQILEGFGKVYPFAATFSPRVWNGTILYNNITLCTPLPIELLHFTAKAKSEKVELTWSTSSETNNDYFTLEKSNEGKAWSELGKVKGAGNSTFKIDYNYTDLKPYNGISYYRLKQTDFDGNFEYSDIASVEFDRFGIEKLLVYPNPATTEWFVVYENIDETKFQLHDALGQDVKNQVQTIKRSDNMLELKIGHLAKGVYLLTIDENVRRLIIEN